MINFQKLESAAILIGLLTTYYKLDFSWVWFAVFLFVPDVFMVGYLKDPKIGAVIYNIGHSYFAPIILFAIAWFEHSDILQNVGMLAVIWAAHIAMDRTLGFGLKYPTGFKDTHLGRIGK